MTPDGVLSQQTFGFWRKMFHQDFHEPIWKFFEKDSLGVIDYSSPVYGIDDSLAVLYKQYEEILAYIKWMSEPAYNELSRANLDRMFERLCTPQ